MPDTAETFQVCASCRVTIYPEHIERHLAEYWSGQLLCRECAAEKKGQPAPARSDSGAPIALAGGPASAAPTFPAPRSHIQTSSPLARVHKTYTRPLIQGAGNATRCRTFHCRITEAAIANMNEQINEWTDSHPEIEIKFATTVMAAMNDKATEQQMILNVFY